MTIPNNINFSASPPPIKLVDWSLSNMLHRRHNKDWVDVFLNAEWFSENLLVHAHLSREEAKTSCVQNAKEFRRIAYGARILDEEKVFLPRHADKPTFRSAITSAREVGAMLEIFIEGLSDFCISPMPASSRAWVRRAAAEQLTRHQKRGLITPSINSFKEVLHQESRLTALPHSVIDAAYEVLEPRQRRLEPAPKERGAINDWCVRIAYANTNYGNH